MNNTYNPPFPHQNLPRYDYSGLAQPTPVYVGDPSSSYVDILQRTVHGGIDHAGSAYALPRGNFTMREPDMRFHTGLYATQDVRGGRMSLNASSSSSSTTLSTAFSGHSRHPTQNTLLPYTSYGPMQMGYPAPTVNNRLPTYDLNLPGMRQNVGGGLSWSTPSRAPTYSTAFSGHSRHPNQNISFSCTSCGPMQMRYPAPTVNNRLPPYGLSLPGNTIAGGHHYPSYSASLEPSIETTQQVYGPEHCDSQASYAPTMGLAAEYYGATEHAYSSRIESNMYARTETVYYTGNHQAPHLNLEDRPIASCSTTASVDHQCTLNQLNQQGNTPDIEHQTHHAYTTSTMSEGSTGTDEGEITNTLAFHPAEQLRHGENKHIIPKLNDGDTAREGRSVPQCDSFKKSRKARPSSKRSVKTAKTPRAKKEKSSAVAGTVNAPPKKRVTGKRESEIDTLKLQRLYTPKQPYIKRKDNRQKPTMEVNPQIAVASNRGVEWEWKIDES